MITSDDDAVTDLLAPLGGDDFYCCWLSLQTFDEFDGVDAAPPHDAISGIWRASRAPAPPRRELRHARAAILARRCFELPAKVYEVICRCLIRFST